MKKHIFITFGLSFLLSACGAFEELKSPRKTLPPVFLADISNIDEETKAEVAEGLAPLDFFENDIIEAELNFEPRALSNSVNILTQAGNLSAPAVRPFPQLNLVPQNTVGACQYLRYLAREQIDASSTDGQIFQLFEQLYILHEKEGPSFWGSLNLKNNLPMLFGLSSELGGGSKPIDPPTLSDFMTMAEEGYENGDLSWFQINALRMFRRLGMNERLAKERNKAVLGIANRSLPGAVDGKAQELNSAEPIKMFLSGSRVLNSYQDLTEEQFEELGSPLIQKLPLYSERVDLAQDFRRVLFMLAQSQKTDAPSLSLREESCLFTLSLRMQAQMLQQKGFVGAPNLEADGTLLDEMALTDVATYPEEDYVGAYDEALTAETIKNAVATGEVLRPVDALSLIHI